MQRSIDRTRARRRANHECIKCGKPLPVGYSFRSCEECSNKSKEISRNERNFYKSIGICYICRVRKATEGYKSCPECREKARKIMQKPEYKEINRTKSHTRYHKLKAEGMCVNCGKVKAPSYRIYCDACYEKKKLM